MDEPERRDIKPKLRELHDSRYDIKPGPLPVTAPVIEDLLRDQLRPIRFGKDSFVTPKLTNVLAAFRLNSTPELDLEFVAYFTRSTLNAVNRRVIIKASNGQATVVIFQSSKALCWAQTPYKCQVATMESVLKIQELGYNLKPDNYRILTMSSSLDVQFGIRLNKMAMALPGVCSYEPEIFPGADFRLREPKVQMWIFHTGKIILNGAKDKQEIEDAFLRVLPIVDYFRIIPQVLPQLATTEQTSLPSSSISSSEPSAVSVQSPEPPSLTSQLPAAPPTSPLPPSLTPLAKPPPGSTDHTYSCNMCYGACGLSINLKSII